MKSICHRCHHVRDVNGAGYCPRCSAELRAAEQRRPVIAESTTIQASDLPAPADGEVVTTPVAEVNPPAPAAAQPSAPEPPRHWELPNIEGESPDAG